MRKATVLMTAMVLGLFLMAIPYTASACGGDKASKTSTDASMINSKAANADASSCSGLKGTTSLTKASDKECGPGCEKDCCAGMTSAAKMTSTDATETKFATAVFSVDGMTCGGCEKSVNSKLTKVDGVNEVLVVCHKSSKAVLTYDPEKVNTDELAKKITKMGFEAKFATDKFEMKKENM